MSVAVLEKPETQNTPADRQYIAMRVTDEVYGLDIAVVHTVITPQAITHVPKAPPFIKGVINLRGRILPVVDLRARFGLPPLAPEQERHSRIVVIETDGLSAGLIVDGVSEVLRLSSSAIDPPSHLVSAAGTECIVGIGRIPAGSSAPDGEERLMILLDVFKTVAPARQEAP